MTAQPLPEDPLSDALQEVLLAHTQAQARLSRSLGVRRGDVDALEHLMTGPLGPGELAERLGVTPGAATQLVQRLEARGHARRTTGGGDRRTVEVALTDEGAATVHRHVRVMLERLDRLAVALDRSQSDAVLSYLLGAREALDTLSAPQGCGGED